MGIPFIGDAIETVGSIIKKFVKDKDLAEKLQADTTKALISLEAREVEAQAKVIIAEATGKSWMQRNWRPMIMLMFGFIIFNNFILFPYVSLFTEQAIELQVPSDLWALMKIGLGGYVLGRSGEKIAAVLKRK